MFGDLGIKEQEGANWTLARLKEHRSTARFDAVLHVGDIAYDLRQDGGRTGDEFLADMEPVAAAVPHLTCVGNHERDCTAWPIALVTAGLGSAWSGPNIIRLTRPTPPF